MRAKKMTDTEKEQFDKLYQYVKSEILMYNKTQSIPQSLVLRLKGLAVGKFLENKNIEDKAKYSFEIVLYTFQICKPIILGAISNKSFETESQKFNYICKIIENNLNDVYIRVAKAKQTEEKIENMDNSNLLHSSAGYVQKTENNRNKKLENLW